MLLFHLKFTGDAVYSVGNMCQALNELMRKNDNSPMPKTIIAISRSSKWSESQTDKIETNLRHISDKIITPTSLGRSEIKSRWNCGSITCIICRTCVGSHSEINSSTAIKRSALPQSYKNTHHKNITKIVIRENLEIKTHFETKRNPTQYWAGCIFE